MSIREALSPVFRNSETASAVADLLEELEYCWRDEIAHITDNLSLEDADEQFVVDWFAFYGFPFKTTVDGKINRYALKKWRSFLNQRGMRKTVAAAVTSGGELFMRDPIDVEVYFWYDLPEWFKSDKEDGWVYVVTSDPRVGLNEFVLSMVPAGYRLRIYLRHLVKGVQDTWEVTGQLHSERRVNTLGYGPFMNEQWNFTGLYIRGYTFAELYENFDPYGMFTGQKTTTFHIG